MTLSGWKRIGIIASVAWLIGGGILALTTKDDAYRKRTGHALDSCWTQADQTRERNYRSLDARHLPLGDAGDAARNQARNAVESQMDQEYHACADRMWANNPDTSLRDAGIWSLVTLGIGWILVFALIGLVRWVLAGFGKGRSLQK